MQAQTGEAGPEAAPAAEEFRDPGPGRGYDPQRMLTVGAVDDAIADYMSTQETARGIGKRRGGFSPVPPPLPAAAAEGAAGAAGGAGLGRAAIAGGAGAAALLLAQQGLSMAEAAEPTVGVPASATEGRGGPMSVRGDETDLKDLLDVQRQVARLGLPIKGGPPTTSGGSIL